jgi:hypothetical protein
VPYVEIAYDELPRSVKDNLTADQWRLAQHHVIMEGQKIPQTTYYVNLKNGQRTLHQQGERAEGPLLAGHDLAGGHGQSDQQFEGAPPGAHMP